MERILCTERFCVLLNKKLILNINLMNIMKLKRVRVHQKCVKRRYSWKWNIYLIYIHTHSRSALHSIHFKVKKNGHFFIFLRIAAEYTIGLCWVLRYYYQVPFLVIYNLHIYVWSFGFPIITNVPLDRFASNFDLGTREHHGNILCLVLRFKLCG